jgi:putative transposase
MPERHQADLVAEIRLIHHDSDGVYGSPRVAAELRRRGWVINRKRVARLMAGHGLVGYRPRRRRSLTKPDANTPPAPDLLGRQFDLDQPNVAWCGDITYLPTDEGWLYLASVLDLASRHLLGWSMRDRHDATLVTDALDAAVAARGQSTMSGTIFHTDRGAEYSSAACGNACERLGLRQSMGRTGSCLDNAAAESFFATLKVELVGRRRYRTRAQARASVFAWIAWYNRRRLHSATGYLPPVEWEHRYAVLNPLPSTMAA